METKEYMRKFSIVKLLITILCTVIVTTFIGFTILFISVIPNWMYSEVMTVIDTTEEGIEAGKYWEELFENSTEKDQEEYNKEMMFGEEYSVKGNVLINLIYGRPSYLIVKTFVMSFIIGVVIGTVIYIIVIQQVDRKKMIFELLIAFFILIVSIMLLNLLYQTIINNMIDNVTTDSITYYTHIYDLESNEEYIVIQYIAIIGIIYIINLIKQKILANRLNKELNKN